MDKSVVLRFRLLFFLIFTIGLFPFSSVARIHLNVQKFSELPGWPNTHMDISLASFTRSCKLFERKPDRQEIHSTGVGGTAYAWKKLCKQANQTSRSEAQSFFEENFIPYRVEKNGTFTGYYVTELKGSLTRSARFSYPIYTLPEKSSLSYSRKEINAGALGHRSNVLLWVDDPVQRFFLHVQGSGTIALENGEKILIGFAGKNTHPYHSIGKYMIEQGWIAKEDISAEAIKAWLYAHPEKMATVLEHNPSYIFFRKLEGSMPPGGAGIPLTSGYSLAIDTAYIPYGVPVWLDTTLTYLEKQEKPARFQRLLVTQDTGSAIKGKVRGDIFFGGGREAELFASEQNSTGSYYLLLPKIR